MADVAAEDDLGQPIFSYETANFDRTDISDSVADRVESMRSDESDSMSVTALDETFDLRKAIIYQTIMQRVSA